MKDYKKVFILSLLSLLIGLYFFLTAITAKPYFKSMTWSYAPHPTIDEYYVSGSGVVTTKNKYRVESATVRITVYDENDEVITSQFFDYTEIRPVVYDFKFTQNIPERHEYEFYDVEINNKLDIFISSFLIIVGLGFGISRFIRKKKNLKGFNI